MQQECLLHLAVIRGINLPYVDLLSKIDAYVKVKVKVNGGLVGQTRAVDDNQTPCGTRMCSRRSPSATTAHQLAPSALSCGMKTQSSLVATCVLDLSRVPPSSLHYLELPMDFERSKHAAAGSQARLVVSVKGWVNSFGTLLADTQHIPGALFNTVDRRAYLPVPCPGLPAGSIYLAVEYEKDAVDLKLLVTTPGVPLHADIFMMGRQVSKVRRRVFRDGHQVVPGLTAYEEVKMDDLPLTTDWRALHIVTFDKQLLWGCNSDAVVSAHGWRGAMSFDDACRQLHGVDIDRSEREIYMPIAATAAMMPPEALLLVDYDNNVDIKLAVLDTPSSLDKAWDLTLISGQTVKKTSQVFVPSQPRVGGKWRVRRVCELDDVAYGTAFSSILLQQYQLTNHRQWDVLSLLPLR